MLVADRLLSRKRARACSPASEPPVLLVTPPSGFLLDERVFVSLGILKVAASLEQAGRRVEHLDLSGIENYADAARDAALATSAMHVGLTATTPQLPAAMAVLRAMRDARPALKFILGGPHATLAHAARRLEQKRGKTDGRGHRALAQLLDAFDVVVAGDGEEAVFDALALGARGLVDADDPKGSLFMTSGYYDESPFPARHLVDLGSYRYSIEGRRATSMIAQLGCPFACSFCAGRHSSMLRKIRTRTTASIVHELELLHREHGVEAAMLYDDELNVNREFVALMGAIADLGERLGVDWRLRGFVKAELFTDEQASAMHRAGFRWVLCGFEAADDRILVNINKKATLEDNARVVAISRRHGLKVKALMSVGHAGETEASVLAVRDWLVDVRPDDFDCTVITPYPGSPYYDEAEPSPDLEGVWTYRHPKTGDRLHAHSLDYAVTADYYKGDPEGGYRSYVFTDHLSGDAIVALRDRVEREVRAELGIPFNPGAPGARYEHSMGQGPLPPHLYRTTADRPATETRVSVA